MVGVNFPGVSGNSLEQMKRLNAKAPYIDHEITKRQKEIALLMRQIEVLRELKSKSQEDMFADIYKLCYVGLVDITRQINALLGNYGRCVPEVYISLCEKSGIDPHTYSYGFGDADTAAAYVKWHKNNGVSE